jgi:hypothetical protein
MFIKMIANEKVPCYNMGVRKTHLYIQQGQIFFALVGHNLSTGDEKRPGSRNKGE